MERLGDDSGQTLILVALALTTLLGFAGFATDVGVLLHEKRIAQTAADSAALAGAGKLRYGPTAVQNAALADATLNGFTNGDGVTVTVNNPPLASQVENAGFANTSYVQVIVSKSVPTFFMQLFHFHNINVTASAVAGDGAPSEGCVYVLNPSASNAMELQGSFDVSTPGCGVLVSSNSPNALSFSGSGGVLKAGSVGVVGGDSGQIGDSSPTPVTGIAPVTDPLAWEPVPSMPSSCPAASTLTGTIGPSSSDGIVCYSSSGSITLSNATLLPGTYIFNNPSGAVNFSGAVTGTGVTLYLLGGLNASNGTINLSAPNSGTYQGLVVFAARNDSSQLLFDKGNASGTLSGIIYAPDSPMVLQDSGGDQNGGLSLVTDLIVNTLYDKTADLTVTSYTQTAGANVSPLTNPTLVE